MGDRRDQRRWQRELEEQLRALPTYDGETPDGGPVAPLGRLPRTPRERRRRRRRRERAAAATSGYRPPGARSERRRTIVTVVLTLVIIGVVLSTSQLPVAAQLRSLLGWEGDRGDGSSYAFLQEDPLTGDPYTWSSCDPVRLVVNPEGAPDGWSDDLDGAVAEVSRATGLDLEIEGTTDDRPGGSRRGRFGGAEPVLVAWATPDEESALEGDVIGVASAQSENGFYVTGTVVFDEPQFAGLERRGEGRVQRAITMHELGHLMGLDHVDDDRQLMYPTTTFQSTFGEGDLEGLRQLGEGGCR